MKDVLERKVELLARLWTSAKTFGISVILSISRDNCTHKNIDTKVVDGSGRGVKDYFMPYCKDCGMCFPNRGRFRCVEVPYIKLSNSKDGKSRRNNG